MLIAPAWYEHLLGTCNECMQMKTITAGLLRLATGLRSDQSVQGAVNDCDTVLALDPRNASALGARGDVKRMLGDHTVTCHVCRCEMHEMQRATACCMLQSMIAFADVRCAIHAGRSPQEQQQ